MRILGIDCGSESTGFGVIETDGQRHRLVIEGAIRTTARPASPLNDRGEAIPSPVSCTGEGQGEGRISCRENKKWPDSSTETEFPGYWRSQTEFGNEDVRS